MNSRLLQLYSLMMILYDGFLIMYIYQICQYYSSSSLNDIIGSLKTFMIIFTHCAVLMHSYTSRNTLVNILKMFDGIDSVMIKHLFIEMVPKSINKKLVWQLIAGITALFASYANFFLLMSNSVDIWLFLPVIAITRMRSIQISFYVGLLRDRLEKINDELFKIVQPPDSDQSLYRKASLENENYERLQALKNLYGCIWDISNMLSDCFGWSFVIIATEQFVEMLCNAHLIFVVLASPDMPNSTVIYTFSEAFPFLFTFTMVCIDCHLCSKKVNIIKNIY